MQIRSQRRLRNVKSLAVKLSRLLLAALPAVLSATPAASNDSPGGDAVARYEAWQSREALPALELVPAGDAPQLPTGSRIGGPVWLPQGEAWPLDRAGKRMTFLAQIDFAALPVLPDYPTSGVLQFFIARDDLYGANFERPQQGDFRVIYRETMVGPGRLETGPVAEGQRYVDDFSPLEPAIVSRGVALAAQPILHRPDIGAWQYHDAVGQHLDQPGEDALYAHLSAIDPATQSNWRVGGHPEFTQSDWRSDSEFRDVDRVLLHLWTSDGILMWGDSGQGHFAIRREDLLKRDFSKVFYSWDCY